ncbi:hypothetical protein AIOGIFDO_00857 [Candidatus Methanoperedenaceae archaeon GB37]|nr:hypothetical protein AIOGIFDO_00857 [Candidatus Methanoperedenaceae archaeon GB37]
MTPEKLEETYTELLSKYLFEGDDETALYNAYEFSRECINEKVGLEEITAVHTDAIGRLTENVPLPEIPLIVSKSSVFFLEFIMNYSLLYREYFDRWEQMEKELQDTIRETGEALTACLNLEKTLEIISSLIRKAARSEAIIIYLLKDSRLSPVHRENVAEEAAHPIDLGARNTLAENSLRDAEIKIAITPDDLSELTSVSTIKNGRTPSSAIGIPLIGENSVVGAIECYYETPYALSGLNREMLLELSRRAARSIETIDQFRNFKNLRDLDWIKKEEAVHRCKIARKIILGEGKEGYLTPNKVCKGLHGLLEHLDEIDKEEIGWIIEWVEYLGDFELAARIRAEPERFKELVRERYNELKDFVF